MANRWDEIRAQIKKEVEFAIKCSTTGTAQAKTPNGGTVVATASSYCGKVEIYEFAPKRSFRGFVDVDKAKRKLLKKARRWVWVPEIPKHPLEVLALAEEHEEVFGEA